MAEYAARFLIGGLIVTIFSVIADVLRPRRFAGLFGAAPSVALASLALVITLQGPEEASIQARSMIFGAVALWIFSIISCQLMFRTGLTAWKATSLAMICWLTVAFGYERLLHLAQP